MKKNIFRSIIFSFLFILFLIYPKSISADCTKYCMASWIPNLCYLGGTRCIYYHDYSCGGDSYKCCDTVEECNETEALCSLPRSCVFLSSCPYERIRNGSCTVPNTICCAPPPDQCASPNTCVDSCPLGQEAPNTFCPQPEQVCCEPEPEYCGAIGQPCCPSGQPCNNPWWFCDLDTNICTDDPGGDKPDPRGECPEGEINTAIGCVATTNPTKFTITLLRWGMGIAGGVSFLLMVYAGFIIMTSSGNPKRLTAGKELLIAAIMGLILLVSGAYFLRLIGISILGLF